MPISEGIVKYQYVVMAKTHRYEARIAERSVNLLGLPGGAVVDVQDSFRSPKAHILKSTRYHGWSRKCPGALTFENFEPRHSSQPHWPPRASLAPSSVRARPINLTSRARTREFPTRA